MSLLFSVHARLLSFNSVFRKTEPSYFFEYLQYISRNQLGYLIGQSDFVTESRWLTHITKNNSHTRAATAARPRVRTNTKEDDDDELQRAPPLTDSRTRSHVIRKRPKQQQ